MIRNAGYAMEQFCRRCAAKGIPHEDCWWPLTAEFFQPLRNGARVTQWGVECKACRAERDHAAKLTKAERQAA